MDYPETTSPRDPSHNQPPDPDTCICQHDFAEGTDPVIAVSYEAMPVPGKYRSGCSQSASYWMEHRAPNVGARENTQGAKGICNPIGGTTI